MATTVLSEIQGVRTFLNSPLPQAPSFRDVLDEMEAEYQAVTNETNNTANAWQVDTYTLTTTRGVRAYQIETTGSDFFKALNVTTVPASNSVDPQYMLEFTELEHLPQDWSWLGENKGQYMTSSHDSQVIAFYRKIGDSGEEIWCELRPTPTEAQSYSILYQVTDWWPKVEAAASLDGFTLPHSSQRFYIRALVAQNLLLNGKVKWHYDIVQNYKMGELVAKGLELKLARYKKAYDEYIDSLDQPDSTQLTSWASENVWQ